ncbi:MAG TPA: peptidase E [Planctomycetota bacterium]|nr:peptidase E [Planctomycetota bacterium]
MHRALIKRLGFACLAVLALCPGSKAGGQEAGTARKKLIFAVGGSKTSKEAVPLMKAFLELTGKANPKVCLLPTASGDSAESIVTYYDIMNQLECRPRHLRLFQPSRVDDFEKYLMDMDAIYVGGGNTLNMLAIWKEQGIDKILRKAWEKGIVLGGESAGAICWFRQGCTDSRPGKLTALDGLGWLPGSACPHFSDEKRRKAYQDMLLAGELQDGIACEDGVAVLYEGEKLVRIVNSVPKARAYRVRRQEGNIEMSALEPEFLGK